MTTTASRSFACLACGTSQQFTPGSFSAWCSVCDDDRPLPRKYPEAVPQLALPTDERVVLGSGEETPRACGQCGAVVQSRSPSLTCLFCAAGQAPSSDSSAAVLPIQALLPMLLGPKAARAKLDDACARLGISSQPVSLKPAMLPWVSVGVHVSARYKGERGEYHEDHNRRQRLEWSPVASQVEHAIFDTGGVVSKGLPPGVARRLSNWDWPFLAATQPRCANEMVELDRADLIPRVLSDLEATLEHLIRGDIGGDEQRIHQKTHSFSDPRYRAVLVPVWTGKLVHLDRCFAINGRTGEVVVDSYEAQGGAGEDELDHALAEGEARERRREQLFNVGRLLFFAVIVAMLVIATQDLL